MNGSHWDDRKVEKRLKEIPKVKDEQVKDELYELIKNRIDMDQGESRVKVNKRLYKKQWFFPTIASLAAAFIMLLIIPPLFTEDELSSGNDLFVANQIEIGESKNAIQEKSVADNSDEQESGERDHAGEVNEETVDSENEPANEEITGETDPEVVAIPYVEDVQMKDMRSFHVMVVGVERESLGLIGEMKNEPLFNIFSNNNIDRSVEIEGLEKVEIDEIENTVTLDFSRADRLESLSSSETLLYRSAIMEILSVYGFEKVLFTANGEPGVMIGQTGFLEYAWDLPYENRGYYLYTNADGEEFFLRGVSISEWALDDEGELTFSETLEDMKHVKEDAWYEPTIPEELQFNEIKEEEGGATITLAADSRISDKIIETIRLVASDFSFDYVTIIKKGIEEAGEDIKRIKIPVHPIPYYNHH